jgi:hypothetical protein
MGKPWARKLGPQNTYAVVTIMALIFTLPFVAFFDYKTFPAVYDAVIAAGTKDDVINYSVFSGLAFYIYNEASFLTLSKVSVSAASTLSAPVATATASRRKRAIRHPGAPRRPTNTNTNTNTTPTPTPNTIINTNTAEPCDPLRRKYTQAGGNYRRVLHCL